MPRFELRALSRLTRAANRVGIIVNEHTLGESETVRLVDSLSRWFEFVSLDELSSRLPHSDKAPFCLLTFDDGKKSNATVTAPVLRRLGVPAAFYVVTDFLSQGEPLWFDAYRALLEKVGSPPPGLEKEYIKELPHRVRRTRISRELARSRVKVPVSEDSQAMSWDDARELAAQGFTIGAHGLTHAILTCESRQVAFREIEESIARVGRELGSPCRTFAFPNGNHDGELSRYAAACGATTVMTTVPTWVGRSTPLWRLPRIQLYPSSSRMHIKLKVGLATIPGALVNPDGTRRSYAFERLPFDEAGAASRCRGDQVSRRERSIR